MWGALFNAICSCQMDITKSVSLWCCLKLCCLCSSNYKKLQSQSPVSFIRCPRCSSVLPALQGLNPLGNPVFYRLQSSSHMNSGQCPENQVQTLSRVALFHTCSTQQETVLVRRVLTCSKFCFWFRQGVATAQSTQKAGNDAKGRAKSVCLHHTEDDE